MECKHKHRVELAGLENAVCVFLAWPAMNGEFQTAVEICRKLGEEVSDGLEAADIPFAIVRRGLEILVFVERWRIELLSQIDLDCSASSGIVMSCGDGMMAVEHWIRLNGVPLRMVQVGRSEIQ